MISKRKTSIVGGALSLTLSALTVKVLGLIYKVPLSYMLSDEGMSYFNSAYTVYTFFFIICTAGIPKAISILVSETESDGNARGSYETYTSALKFFGGVGIIISCLFLLLSKPISILIGNKNAFLTMVSIAPSIYFICMSGVMRGYLNGTLNLLPIAISELISGVSRLLFGLVFAFIAYRINLDIILISAFTIFGTTLGSFISYLFLSICINHKYVDEIVGQNRSLIKINTNSLKRILRISIPLTVTSAIGSVGNIIDLGIIMKRLQHSGYTELQASVLYGNYTTLTVPMVNLVATLIAPIGAVLLPIISRLNVKGDKKLLAEKISLGMKLAVYISIPISFMFYYSSRDILRLIFDDSSANLGFECLRLVSFGIVFMSLLTVLNTVLEALGKTKAPLYSMLIGCLVKLLSAYFFIGKAEYGILGASVSTVISYAVSFLISFVAFILYTKISPKFLKALLFTTVFSFISIRSALFFTPKLPQMKGINIIITLFIFGSFYLVFCYIYNLLFKKESILPKRSK